MSKRDIEDDGYYRGSSRSSAKSRDDHKKVSKDYSDSERRNRRDRSRSRERSRRRSRSRDHKDESRRRPDKPDTNVKEMSISPQRESKDSSTDGITIPPKAPMITKISIGFKNTAPKIQLSSKNPLASLSSSIAKKAPQVASVFNDGSDEEPEEMPPEARMRMRNIGRDTPTSVGPNSFGKTKHGFCDQKAITQKNLKAAMDKANPSAHSGLKYPSTVYKLG